MKIKLNLTVNAKKAIGFSSAFVFLIIYMIFVKRYAIAAVDTALGTIVCINIFYGDKPKVRTFIKYFMNILFAFCVILIFQYAYINKTAIFNIFDSANNYFDSILDTPITLRSLLYFGGHLIPIIGFVFGIYVLIYVYKKAFREDF